jgi:peptide deformylase
MAKNSKHVLDIVEWPEKILSGVCNEYIEGFDSPWLYSLAVDMIHTMQTVRGVGLAAPQVGLPLRVAVALIDKRPIVLINPKLTGHPDERKVSIEEGCLSCPNESVRISRYEWIRVDYDDLKGNRKWLELNGINAIIIQHEMDHLDGKLIVDYKEKTNE